MLVCLSSTFLGRSWTESELSAALALQNRHGHKRVLPLILNAKREVLDRYPLLGGTAYKDFASGGAEAIADGVLELLDRDSLR